jgi:hypothetical protein
MASQYAMKSHPLNAHSLDFLAVKRAGLVVIGKVEQPLRNGKTSEKKNEWRIKKKSE